MRRIHFAAALSCVWLSACGQPAPEPASETSDSSTIEAIPAASEETAAVTDPVAHGKTLFARCVACHSVEPGKNGIGPSLHAIVGKPSASQAGFAYSSAMQGAKLTWDEQTLSAYLENPQALVKGNKMAFAGLKKPEDRTAVISYLNSLK
jgi:cytochrome c